MANAGGCCIHTPIIVSHVARLCRARYTTAYNRHYTDRWQDHKRLVDKQGPLTAKRDLDREGKKRNQQRSNDMVIGVYTGLYPP